MITLLQPVALAERCLLSELLYWVALRRFPLAISDLEDGDFRFSKEFDLLASSVVDSPVSYAECEFANLRPNPRYTAFIEGTVENDFAFLKRMEENIKRLTGEDRNYLVAQRDDAMAKANEIDEWDREFHNFIDYYKSKIFVDLRNGKLIAEAITVAGSNEQELREIADNYESRLEELAFSAIDITRWTYNNIDWENSILFGRENSCCWIRFDVNVMLSVYPIPELGIASTVRKLCDLYVLESQNREAVPHDKQRGRPPLPWDLLHVEIAARARAGTLPAKKEAAIGELAEWFRDKHGIVVSRSSIGQKLTPYYQRLFQVSVENPQN
jgi:hypothetical protein